MANRKRQYVWVQKPIKPVFDASSKEKLLQKTQQFVNNMEKLRQKVSRISMRGNRIYLYQLVEQCNPKGAVFIKPLIDDKYIEYPYARITLLNVEATKCTADWQRHNDQWMSIYQGTFDECLSEIEGDNMWFD